jgi:5-methylcytosine-specific restriction endonuclease McrA
MSDTEEEWTGSKRQREDLRRKFDGKCAYCGNPLGSKMHADHLKPIIRIDRDCWNNPLPKEDRRLLKPDRNTLSNMMPACAPCNLHKGRYSLDEWRDIIERSADIIRRQTSTFRAGERFGIIVSNEAPVIFYFEKGQSS